MVKAKRLVDRVRKYYRGPVREATKVADSADMGVISEALLQCVPKRSKNAFKINWKQNEIQVKLVIGLKATLRHLKRRETIGIVLDDSSPVRIENLLIELANKVAVPVVKARGLLKLAPELKLNTVQAFCLVDTAKVSSAIYSEGDPRPQPVESVLEVESLNELATLLQNTSSDDKYTFRDPKLDLVRSTGKSKVKKEAKKMAKKAAIEEKKSGEEVAG